MRTKFDFILFMVYGNFSAFLPRIGMPELVHIFFIEIYVYFWTGTIDTYQRLVSVSCTIHICSSENRQQNILQNSNASLKI